MPVFRVGLPLHRQSVRWRRDTGGSVAVGLGQRDLAPSGPPPAEGDQTQADQTQAFRDFAVLDTVRPPEWLALVTSVYRAEDGMMWAITRWPAGYVDRGRNVQAVCGVLSSFVLRTAGGEFSGVTVRAVDGSELVTRKVQEDSCAT
jgi:hypothetical protein